MFGEVLERMEAFFHYKNIDFQNSPNLHFCYGVSLWFLPKNENCHSVLLKKNL